MRTVLGARLAAGIIRKMLRSITAALTISPTMTIAARVMLVRRTRLAPRPRLRRKALKSGCATCLRKTASVSRSERSN